MKGLLRYAVEVSLPPLTYKVEVPTSPLYEGWWEKRREYGYQYAVAVDAQGSEWKLITSFFSGSEGIEIISADELVEMISTEEGDCEILFPVQGARDPWTGNDWWDWIWASRTRPHLGHLPAPSIKTRHGRLLADRPDAGRPEAL